MRQGERTAMRVGERGLRRSAPQAPVSDSWSIRSSLPGVVAADNIATQSQFDSNLFYNDPTRKTYYDTTIKLSGNGSVRNDILTGTTGAGQWNDYMFDWRHYVTQNSEIRVQWRQRFSQSWVDQNGGRPGGYISEFKNFVILHGNNAAYQYGKSASCPANQFTIVERHPQTDGGAAAVGYPMIFHRCGHVGYNYQPLNQYKSPGYESGGTVLSWQNVRNLTNNNHYSSVGAPGHREDDPFRYAGDEWMTFMIRLKMGPYGQALDSITGQNVWGYTDSEAWFYLARQDEPMRVVHHQTGMVFSGYEPNNNGVYIASISGTTVTTGSAHGRSGGDTVWVFDTLDARLDGNSYTVAVISATQLTLIGAPSANVNHGSLYFVDPIAAGIEDNEQPDPSPGQGRCFLYPTGYEGRTIAVAEDAYIWIDEMIASEKVLPTPGKEPPLYIRNLSPLQGKSLIDVKSGNYNNLWSAFQDHPLYSGWDSVRPGGYVPAKHVQSVFSAWCGAAGDEDNHIQYVHGGGHDDGAWNGIVKIDFNSDDGVNPNGITIVPDSLSDASDVIRSTDLYLDGRPTAIHSYDQLAFDSVNNRLVRIAGAAWDVAGAQCFGYYSFDFDTNVWVKHGDWTPITTNLKGMWDPITNKLLMFYQWHYWVMDLPSMTFPVNQVAHNFGQATGTSVTDSTGVFDYTRGRGVSIGVSGPTLTSFTTIWDRTDNTVSLESELTIPSNLNDKAPGGCYDHHRDCYWWYNPVTSDPGSFARLHRLDGADLTWSEYTITGDVPSITTIMRGHYGRLMLLDGWDALGFSYQYDNPAWVLKLPD